jgi:hypothetical protein
MVVATAIAVTSVAEFASALASTPAFEPQLVVSNIGASSHDSAANNLDGRERTVTMKLLGTHAGRQSWC